MPSPPLIGLRVNLLKAFSFPCSDLVMLCTMSTMHCFNQTIECRHVNFIIKRREEILYAMPIKLEISNIQIILFSY